MDKRKIKNIIEHAEIVNSWYQENAGLDFTEYRWQGRYIQTAIDVDSGLIVDYHIADSPIQGWQVCKNQQPTNGRHYW